ncbi:hypothetical protein [Budvicia aquatica]|uniref:Uncharacterized protein n=2 Tax=Budvicia aquatica TaxID=82979 RepID=A0A2C6DJ65_9GAMM|nr:hypothetical protein [Budvicia aquatica]PHI28794.1 hypothetical protein CRN84_05420 [Budvicia aquatica]VFS46855.1 Uncharacterised protein [Budvicia aquatica]
MKINMHIPIVNHHHQDITLGNMRTGSNPQTLFPSHEAVNHSLLQQVRVGQTHYQTVQVDGNTRLVDIVMN